MNRIAVALEHVVYRTGACALLLSVVLLAFPPRVQAQEKDGDAPKKTTPASSIKIPPSQLFKTARRRESEGPEGLQHALSVYRTSIRAGAAGDVKQAAWFGVVRCEYMLQNFWASYLASEQAFPKTYDAKTVTYLVDMQMLNANALKSLGHEKVSAGDDGEKKITGFEAASRIYDRIVYNDPNHKRAPMALLAAGDCFIALGEYAKAEGFYKRLIEEYETAPQAEEAKAALAKALILKSKDGKTDTTQGEVDTLIREVNVSSESNDKVQERREDLISVRNAAYAADLLRKARQYADHGGKKGRGSAVFYCNDIIAKYPDTPSAQEAKTLLDSLSK